MRLWDTVSNAGRYQDQQAILAAWGEVKGWVDDLWQELNDWKTVAQQLRKDTLLSDPLRSAALTDVLRRAARRSEN